MIFSRRCLAPHLPIAVLALGLIGMWSTGTRAQPAGPNPAIVETQCRTCHGEMFVEVGSHPHGIFDTPEWRERTGQRPGCLNCHGDVSTHISQRGGQGNVFAFREEPPTAINETCLGCHASTHPEFERSAHAEAGLSCVDCHRQHDGQQARQFLLRDTGSILARLDDTGDQSRVCIDCHQDVFAAFSLNERHKLREGVLECTSCHDPHEPATRINLGGFKQEQCIDCHTDKGGPFVFEHPASRVESCTACHTPHGSPNRHLLSHQRVAELCISCHAVLPGFHLGANAPAEPRFGLETQCTNCHSAIHGSNFHPRFLR